MDLNGMRGGGGAWVQRTDLGTDVCVEGKAAGL